MSNLTATEFESTESNQWTLDETITGIWMSLLIFTQVTFPKFVPIFIVFGILHTIYGIIRNKRKFHFSWITVGFSLLYFCYLVGILFSENLQLGLSYLENKLSFLVFAFVFSFRPFRLPWKWFYFSLITSVLIAILLGFLNGYFTSVQFPEFSKFVAFSGSYFSYLHHPTYFAVYILLAFFMLLEFRKVVFFQKMKFLFWGFLALFVVSYLLTASLSAYLFLMMLIVIFSIKFIFKLTNKVVGWFLLALLSIGLFFTIWSIPVIKIQIQSSITYVSEFVKNPQQFIESKSGYIQGDETRLVMWTVTTEEILDHPLGVGTGSVDFHLSERLNRHGLHQLAKMDEKRTIAYNPHNQFLQITLEVGFFGLLIFIFILVSALRKARKANNLILSILVFSLLFNSLFESMLQRQSGIVFYSFLILFLFFLSEYRKTNDVKR